MDTLDTLRGMDIYLIDLILKGRFTGTERILDAGVGSGRNLAWFVRNGYEVAAVDIDAACEFLCKERYPEASYVWKHCAIEKMPFEKDAFDHITCSAVLHFARNHRHFNDMFDALVKVLKPQGTLFIRTCVDFGSIKNVVSLGNGRFKLPDDSERYLFEEEHIYRAMKRNGLCLLESLRGTHVVNQRVMGTLVFGKGNPG